MNPDIITGGLIAGFFAILGGWLGQKWSRKNSIEAIKAHEFLKVGMQFKESFVEAFNRIHNSSLDTLDITFLKNQIPIQETAFKTFIVHIPSNKRKRLRDTWNEYKCKDDNEFRNEYTAVEGSDEATIIEKRQLILDRIDCFFHFTDPQFVFGDNANV